MIILVIRDSRGCSLDHHSDDYFVPVEFVQQFVINGKVDAGLVIVNVIVITTVRRCGDGKQIVIGQIVILVVDEPSEFRLRPATISHARELYSLRASFAIHPFFFFGVPIVGRVEAVFSLEVLVHHLDVGLVVSVDSKGLFLLLKLN